MKKIFILLLLSLATITLQAKNTPVKLLSKLLKDNSNDISFTDITNLSRIDLEILHLMPVLSDYDKIETKLTKLNTNQLKVLDSIDFSTKEHGKYTVKIYLQNYAYQSANSYDLIIDKKSKKDELILTYLYYDMKIKPIIDDFEVFRDKKISYTIERKQLNYSYTTQRIILRKKDILY